MQTVGHESQMVKRDSLAKGLMFKFFERLLSSKPKALVLFEVQTCTLLLKVTFLAMTFN